MKHIVLILAVFFMANTALSQQDGKKAPAPIPDDKSIEAIVTNLSEELSLSMKQEEQFSRLYVEHYENLKIIFKKTNTPNIKTIRN